MSSLFRRGPKKQKNGKKLAKEVPIGPSRQNTTLGTSSKPAKKSTTMPNKVEEGDDVKEVLHLFNKLEELVVDGDPRVKQALEQKPGSFKLFFLRLIKILFLV